MPSCSVVVCKNSSTKVNYVKDGISFHTYPKNPTIKEKWIKATGKKRNWFPSKYSTICSIHFEQTCFQPLTTVRRLFEWSVPTLKIRKVLTNSTEPSTSKEVPTIAEPDAGTSTRSETTSHDVFRPHTDVVTMPQVVSSRTSNSRFLVVGHDQNTQASTSATTSQEKDARVKKRKGSLPEAKTIIKSVFNYLQTEYENFKTFTGGSCDLSPLENILGRTAAAIGVSEDEITAVLDERGSDDSSDESSSKRARVSRDNYDGSISPIEEDSSEEKADEAQPDNRESTFEAEENLIETLKVEIDENVEYHSKPNTGILFQTPFTREQMSVLHQSLSLTEPTHAEVKQEPADVEEQQKMSVCHHTSLTEPTHAEVKQELVDVKEQQRLKQMELSDDVEYTGGEQDPLGDTEYPSSPTMQVGRLPD